MKKEYSLAIGVNKLKEIKKNKGGVISHCESRRWIDFVKKRRKRVRFFDTVFNEECVCIVADIKRIRQLEQTMIRIEVKL